ncbi:MAG TPA: aminoglycoside 6-adenylyltransferase [Pelolinea sp.]|nr:aminoglycoside 6-adenylyltransferase [Pelolinea sp.]
MKGSIQGFLDRITNWASNNEDIRTVILVGSFARGEAKDDSDVDFVIIAENPDSFLKDDSFAHQFGNPSRIDCENWGKVQSLRVWYENSLEVEFSFTTKNWLTFPLDIDSCQVLSDGYLVLVDKDMLAKKIQQSF